MYKEIYMPREKAIEKGIQNLKDSELVALLISTGVKGNNVLTLSKEVISLLRNGLEEIDLMKSFHTLSNLKGIGEVKALKIIAAVELGKRLYSNDSIKILITSTQKAYEILKNIENKKQEHLVGLYLNSRYELQKRKTIYIGNSNKIHIQPRDIVTPALELNSAFLILAHNHPSGDHSPSEEDIAVTKRIKSVCEIIGIDFLEHIVVGKGGFSIVESE